MAESLWFLVEVPIMKRTIRLRPYVIAIVLILLVFAGIDYLLARYIRNLYLSRLEAEYSNYARYSHSLTRASPLIWP